MNMDSGQFQDTFFEEAEEHVATMEEGLLTLEEQLLLKRVVGLDA